MDGLTYLSRHLGYRYVLRGSSLDWASPLREEATCTILLENTGFSVSYRPFDVTLVLEQTDTGELFQVPLSTDLRLLSPGRQTSLQAALAIRDYPVGTYTLSLKITDPASGFRIYLANDMEQGENGYAMGTLSIRKFPQ